MRKWVEFLCFYNEITSRKLTSQNMYKVSLQTKCHFKVVLSFHYVSILLTILTQIRLDHVLYQTLNFAVIQSEVVFYILEQAKTQLMKMDGAGRSWLLFATLIVPLFSLGEWNLLLLITKFGDINYSNIWNEFGKEILDEWAAY